MKIYLLDINTKITNAWNKYFKNEEEVEIVNLSFSEFMDHNKVDCIVSPANSFGLMDGGYDGAITDYFGNELQRRVQSYIKNNFFGEQPVGTSFIIETPIQGIKLIHTPTMRIPERITDSAVVYNCMRSSLIIAKRNNMESILFPAFGGCTGAVEPECIARMMYFAYKQISNPPTEISWEYAIDTHYRKRWR